MRAIFSGSKRQRFRTLGLRLIAILLSVPIACTTDLAQRLGGNGTADGPQFSDEAGAPRPDAASPSIDVPPEANTVPHAGAPDASAPIEPIPTTTESGGEDPTEPGPSVSTDSEPTIPDSTAELDDTHVDPIDGGSTPVDDDARAPVVEAGATLQLLQSEPASGEEGVAIDTSLLLTFDQDVTPGEGAIVLIAVDDALTVATVEADSSRASFEGVQVTIDWQTGLRHDTEYAVLIEPGAIQSTSGDAFAGITEYAELSFTTGPPAPITLVTGSPTTGTDAVAISSNVTLTFSEEIVAGAVGTIALVEASSGDPVEQVPLAGSDRVQLAGATLTFDPSVDLDYGTTYYVTLDAGAVRSVEGASFPGIEDDSTLTFTTVAPPAPELIGTAPLDDAVEVDPDSHVVLTFDQPVQAGTGLVSVRQSSNGSVIEDIAIDDPSVTVSDVSVTIDLTESLGGSTEYYVNLDAGAVVSLLGVSFGGISDSDTVSFTTAALPPPPLTLVGSTPSAAAVQVQANTNIVLIFSESVVTGSGSVTVFRASDGAVVEAVSVQSSQVAVNGDNATIDLSSNLADNTTYYVTVGSGAFISEQGAAFAGILDATTLTFETDDPFVLNQLTPADNATNVAPKSNFVLLFSANVEANTGNIEIRSGAGALVESIGVTSAQVTVLNNQVTIDPSVTLAYDSSFNIRVPAGAFGKVGGQEFAGLLSASDWNFTTVKACDSGEVLGTNGDCYFFSNGPADWADARTACNRGTGWDLAAIKSNSEQTFLQGKVTTESWIGATDAGHADEWRWVKGDSPFWSGSVAGSAIGGAYEFWKDDQPTGGTQDCARILNSANSWRWADAECSEEYGFVCQGPAN